MVSISGFTEPSFYKETFSFHQHISRSPVDDGYFDPSASDIEVKDLVEASSTSLTLSTSDVEEQSRRKSSKVPITLL